MLELNKIFNKVYVFTLNMDEYVENIPHLWYCLSEIEKEQAKEYYTESLSNRYIVSHGILRHILSYYTNQLPKDVEFIFNKYKKPFLKGSNIYFNMSHSHNMVSYAIALNCKIGIDIELYNNTLDIEDLANLVFTKLELQYFSTLNLDKKIEFFYNIWTRKESLIKAVGQGLSYPINTVEAMILSSGDEIYLTNEQDKSRQGWFWYQLELPNNCVGAIAIEQSIDEIVYVAENDQQSLFYNRWLKHLS